MHQTLSLTTLGELEPSSPVNLELPLRPTDRLGGHVVQGHVDGTATVTDVSADGFAKRVRIELPDELLPYVVERGSIAIEGVSLTIADLTDSGLEVSLIPETLERTTLGSVEPGDRLNVECDVLARYVRRQLVAERGPVIFSNRKGALRWPSRPNRPRRRRLALRDHRGGDRGHPARPHGGRLRRREPRERGRPDDGGAVRHPRGDQLHGDPRSGPDLPGAHRRALPGARPQPDGGQERGALPDGVHGLGGGPRRSHHRHLGCRSRPHGPGRDRSSFPARGPGPAGPCLPAEGQGRRRPGAHRADRGRGGPGAPRRPDSGRGDLRDHERGRDDGPRARPGRLLREARPEDGHGRRPDRLPAPHREAGRADRLHQAADQVR